MIRILCSTDDHYAPYAGVMLTSLFENNPDVSFEIFILTRGLSKENAYSLHLLGEKYPTAINILQVDLAQFSNCPLRPGDHITLEAYFRLMATQLLPERIDRILYLDVDIVIDGSIRELWEMNIDNYAIGGVVDESFCNKEVYARLRLNPDIPYFNSGVLLMNLNYWREHHVMERCMKCISDNPNILTFHDQDTLNIVLKDEIVYLPIRYNFQTGYYLSWIYPDYPAEFKQQVQNEARRPIVIHYSGPLKPWTTSSDHPYRNKYLHYKKLSIWKDYPLIKDATPVTILRLALGRLAKQVGLVPKKYAIR